MNLACWWKIFADDCLTELIEGASKNNFDFRIAVARIEEVGAYYQINRAKLFPEADGLLTLNREHYSAQVAQNEFLQANQLTLDFLRCAFSVFWELDLWGRLRRAYSAAYAEYEASIEDARGVYIVLVSNVASAYIDLRALEKNIEILTKRIAVDSSLLALQKERATSGLDNEILLQQTIAQLQESKSQLPLLESLYAQTHYGLALLLGELPEKFIWCKKDSPKRGHIPQAALPVKTGLPSELLRRRPDIRSAERLLAASTERIGEAIADFFPRFPLLATVGTESSNPKTWFSAGSLHWFVGVDTRWPLINFGRVTYSIQARSAVQKQALLTYCQSVVKALSEVEGALVEYSKQQERVIYLVRRLEAVGKERDLARDLFNAGLADQSRSLLTEKTYLDAERLLTDAKRAAAGSLITIYKALGGGWNEVCDV
jgi:NodT family efflux transporter outer membrane factor (OMF) lipoprotein